MYIPLNIKTNYSLLSSLVDIDNLIKKAKSLGITTLAITDSNMYGVMDFYKKCIQNDIKPIIGINLVVDDKPILLYAMNYDGYQNLTRLIFLNQSNNITLKDLEEHKSNLICILPHESNLYYKETKKIYDHLYLGYTSLVERESLLEKSEKLVFINEVLYLNKKDNTFLKYLYLIRDNKKKEEIKTYNVTDDHHLMELDEVLSNASKDDLKWMDEINNLCNLEFKTNKHLLPKYSDDESFDARIYLQSLCKVGLQKRLNNKVPKKYVDRLKYELDVINNMGFNDYFLVVYDFVKYAKRNDILVGPGRGSAAGSLVSYCLGITSIDPIKYNLFFERFLNPGRITMPDIDIDFESSRRGEVVNYVTSKYGKKRATPIIAFVTLSGKQALRDIARIFDYTSPKLESLSKLIDPKDSLVLNLKSNDRIRSLIISDDKLESIYKIACVLEGAKRQFSLHAAGVVITGCELDSYIPLQKYNDHYITGYSMEHLEELGLLKIDFLGLENLSTIKGILESLKKDGINISLNNIPLDDKKTLSIFSSVLTSGIFQFETPGMKNFLGKLKPTSLEDLIAAIALFRPGPMDNINSFIRRKYGREQINYLHDDLYEVLKPTYGIIVYQEQIMQIANIMAGYSLGEADILRRAMSKKNKDVLVGEKDKFITKSISKGYDEQTANKVFSLILKFAGFGFNRAHSVAYSLLGYQMAYLKAHYPKYFMCNLLTTATGNVYKTKEYIDECRVLGINILNPDINKSEYSYKVEPDGIRLPLSIISNVGMVTSKEIIKERSKGEFKDFFDFIGRTYGKTINRKVIESLIDSGSLSSFGYNHNTLLYNIDNAITYASLISNTDSSLVEKPIMIYVEEMMESELNRREVAVFGFYLSNHPVLEYKAGEKNIVSLNNVQNYFDKIVDVIVLVTRVKVIKTKKNEDMAFVTVEDETTHIELVLFPNTYKIYSNIDKDDILKVKARVEKRMSTYQLSVIKMEDISKL